MIHSPSAAPQWSIKVRHMGLQKYLKVHYQIFDYKEIQLNNTRNLKKARADYHLQVSWQFTGSVLGFSPAPSLGGQTSVYDHTNPWMFRLHRSHQLYVAGGLVFCSKCGALQSMPRKTRLADVCIPLPEFSPSNPHQRHGSHSKISLLIKGSLTGTHLTRWPNGAKKSVKIRPLRFHIRAPQAPAGNSSSQEGSRERESRSSVFTGPPLFSTSPLGNSSYLAGILANLSANASRVTEDDELEAQLMGAG